MTELSTITNQAITTYGDDDIAAMTKVGDYLPRIQVNGSSSNAVKEGKMTVGTFGLIIDSNNYKELGRSLELLLIAWRPKALRFEEDAPMSYYNRHNPEFQKIQAKSLEPGLNGNTFGPEFLVWMPQEGKFASLYCGNPTLRVRAQKLLARMLKGEENGKKQFGPAQVRLDIELIKKNKLMWHAFDVFPHDTPFPLPDEQWPVRYDKELTKFKNPPESEVETVADESGRER